MASPGWQSAQAALLVLGTVAACGGQAERNPHADGQANSAGQPGGTSVGGTTAKPASPGGSAGKLGGGGTPSLDQGGDATTEGGAPILGEAGSPAGGALGEAGQPPLIDCDPIVFEDPELEATVRAEIAKPTGTLRSADVAGLSVLTASAVTSLKGVECLTDLTSLDIGSLPPGKVTDLSPLAPLVKLEELAIDRNPVASLEPLGKLPKLKTLYMFRIPVELDLAPLASAPQLEFLDMLGDTIKSLTPLGSVSTLTTLNVRQGTILEPESAAALKSVQDLDATSVFSDVAPLAGLTNLTKLRISNKPLSNFSSLTGFAKLRFLDITSAGVTDLAPVASMPELVELAAHGNQITDLGPLKSLPKLNFVVLVENQVTDVAPLAANLSLGNGGFVYLNRNPLNCAAQLTSFQAMQARGVQVNTDCP